MKVWAVASLDREHCNSLDAQIFLDEGELLDELKLWLRSVPEVHAVYDKYTLDDVLDQLAEEDILVSITTKEV